jgi:hypothetical protein
MYESVLEPKKSSIRSNRAAVSRAAYRLRLADEKGG